MLQNKSIYIVTGATGAIGKEIAMQLALEGKSVLLACRNMDKAREVSVEIEKITGNCNIAVAQLSLDSFASIRAFSTHLKCEEVTIKALINNAGTMCRKHTVTVDGFEETIAVNYLGTVLLTQMLIPQIEHGGNIVFTTSLTRKIHTLSSDALHEPETQFSQLGTYGRSKLALTHYALYLAERLKKADISVNCSDPGIVDSNMITMRRWFDPLADLFFRPLISTPADGAKATINILQSQNATARIFTHKKSVKIPHKWHSLRTHKILIETTHETLTRFVEKQHNIT